MKKYATLAAIAAQLTLLLLSNCKQPSIEDFANGLPDIPQDIAATVDPKTLATKIATVFPPPAKVPEVAHAPCCGSTDLKSIKVNFSYTKCAPLRSFIVPPLGNLVFASSSDQSKVRGSGDHSFAISKWKGSKPKTVFDQVVCMTSNGPWNASLREDRSCQNFGPVNTLIINAYGDVVPFVWNGGVENHPPQVQLVSCRQLALTRMPCGGPSTCDCLSTHCPATDTCECGLQW